MIERLDGDESRVRQHRRRRRPRRGGRRALPQAPPLRRVRAARVRLGGAGRARRARDCSRPAASRFGLQTCYDVRFPEVDPSHRRRRRRRRVHAGRVGARPAQGAALARAHDGAGDREHRLRRRGRPRAAGRCGQQHDRRPAWASSSPRSARRPTSRSPGSRATRIDARAPRQPRARAAPLRRDRARQPA